jgi:hypothetical protein
MLKWKDNPTEIIQEENVVEEKIYCLLERKETKVRSSGRLTQQPVTTNYFYGHQV